MITFLLLNHHQLWQKAEVHPYKRIPKDKTYWIFHALLSLALVWRWPFVPDIPLFHQEDFFEWFLRHHLSYMKKSESVHGIKTQVKEVEEAQASLGVNPLFMIYFFNFLYHIECIYCWLSNIAKPIHKKTQIHTKYKSVVPGQVKGPWLGQAVLVARSLSPRQTFAGETRSSR